jgi:hypothetical protein
MDHDRVGDDGMSTNGIENPRMKDRNAPQLSTASWVAIIVGVLMLVAGVIFDIDARSVGKEYERIFTTVSTLLASSITTATTVATNSSNIANLTIAVHDLKTLVENHILLEGKK